MKTAITELKEQLDRAGIKLNSTLFEKYLEKEKQQIIDLCTEAYEMGLGHKEYSSLLSYDAIFNLATNKETLK